MKNSFLKKFFITVVILLVLTVSFVYVTDPFFHYHYPYAGLKPVVKNELNQNPGIAEHFDYDSIIIGSSMTQNFTASDFDKAFPDGGKTVKLTYSAIRTGNMNYMLDKAFKTHNVKNVYMGFDLDPFISEFGTYYFPIPEYLYDDNYLNDVYYIFNKEVLLESMKMLLLNITDKVPPMDDCYKWDAEYSKDIAMSSVKWDMLNYEETVFHQEYLDNAKLNFEANIEPHIKNHPETDFYIFFPPYSILWWNMKLSYGTLDSFFAVEEYLISELIKYDNVKLFGLQNITEVITDLDNYKDYNHYSPEINDRITDILAENEYVLTEDNYKTYLKEFRDFIINYDYSSLTV